MLYLAARMAGHRITALLAVACAVLGGAVLITGTGVLAESGLRSDLPAGRLGESDVVVSARQEYPVVEDMPIALPERGAVPARLVDQVSGLPGVASATGDLSFPAALVTPDGQVVPSPDPQVAGHGWSSTGLLADPRVEGERPTGAQEVAVDRGLADAARVGVGDQVQVVAGGRTAATYRVTAVVDAPEVGILFADSTATGLAGRDGGPRAGTVDLVALRAEDGQRDAVADAVREQVRGTGLVVSTGADRGDVASPGAGAARSLLVMLAGSLAGIILMVTGFVLASALAVAIAGQRRELALMRAVGATPRQIRRLAASQATVIALLATGPGVALGYLLAGRFRGMLVDRGVLPEELPLTFSPLPALATVALVALTVQVSARCAAWRTSRIPATEAVAESRSEPRNPGLTRTVAGLLTLVAATALSVVPLFVPTPLGASTTSVAGIIAAIGLALAGPALVRGVSRLLARWILPRASAPTWLAMSNIRGYALRLAGIVSTLAMAVVFVLTYAFTQTTLLSATAQETRDGTLAQQRLSAPGLGGLPEDLLADVRSTPGVQAASPVTSTTVVREYELLGEPEVESASALILTPHAADVLDLDVTSGTLADLSGATVAVSDEAARSGDVGVGDRMSLVLGDGTPVEPRVVAVYERGLGFGPVALSRDLAQGHTTAGLDESVLVRTDGTGEAQRALTELAASWPGLVVEDADPGSGGMDEAPAEVWINMAVIVVLLAYLLVSIANKIVAATAQRRHEIAALRLNGTTPRQIVAMMRREALAIGVGAVVTGILLSAVPLAFLGLAFLDRPWPAGPVWLLPAAVLTVLATAFVTVELPTRQALRTAPTETLAQHE